MASGPRPVVHVIGTGGTIAYRGQGRAGLTDYGLTDRHFSIDEMLARVPEIDAVATVRCEQLANVPTGDLSASQWIALARRIQQIFRTAPDTAGVVVTHGTSTLEEVAYFLNLTVKMPRPVVITGAMRPLTALSNDAEGNLLDSVRVATSAAAAGRGVLVVLNGEIQAAREVSATSTSRLDTFKSADLGHLGYADPDGEIVFYREATKRHTADTEFDMEKTDCLPRVDIALAYPGCDGAAVDAFFRAGCEGLVAAGLGSGHAPRLFLESLSNLVGSGIPVVVAAQAGSGRVLSHHPLMSRGFVTADNLRPRKARVLLMLALTRSHNTAEIQRMMNLY